jgi:hypothetical protein
LRTTQLVEPVTREALYEMVWSRPMLRVAEVFGVSSSYMARVCVELRVPRPQPGYWMKVEVGRQPPRPDLPSARPGDIAAWRPGETLGTVERDSQRRERETGGQLAGARKAKAHHSQLQAKTRISEHPLLQNVKAMFLKTRESDNGLLRPLKRLLVDVISSKERLDEALEFANALFCALENRGHRVALGSVRPRMGRPQISPREVPKENHVQRPNWMPERPTVVYIGSEAIGLMLYEITEDVESIYAKGDYIPLKDLTEEQRRRFVGPHHWTIKQEQPSGRFFLFAYCPTLVGVDWVQQWREAKSGTLLSQIPKIVKELENAIPEMRLQIEKTRLKQEQAHREWEEQRRAWAEDRERERRAEARRDASADLNAAIAAWDEARKLAAYFLEVSKAAEQLPETERENMLDRIAEAKQLVGGVDPLEVLALWKSPSERL